MDAKQKKIDQLLGALTLEEKVGQMFVFGLTGPIAGVDVEEFVDKYNLGGLRTSPNMRRFRRYLPPGSPGIQNVVRPPRLLENLWDDNIPPFYIRASEYAEVLNGLRRRALSRKHGIPMHFIIDFESGSGSNYLPPGMMDTPSPYGFGQAGDMDLITRASEAIAIQLKRIGIDVVNSPVADVNINPYNTGTSTRAYGPNAELVTRCVEAALAGVKKGNLIATLKHFPGGGGKESDAHYGVAVSASSREEMENIFLAPYKALVPKGVVPCVMLQHGTFASIDPTDEVATVSKPIVTGVLREQLGFKGVIITDSITMGGLMARYTVAEAVIRAVEAGVDQLLLKDDNCLRYEALEALVQAVRSRRLSEERLNESLRRIWSLKWDHGLFENGGMVDPKGLDEWLMGEDFRKLGREAAEKVLHVLRDEYKVLPLKPEQKVLLIDRVTPSQLMCNDSWQHPGMLHEFMRKYSDNVTAVDYTPQTMDAVNEKVEILAPQVDAIVVTADHDRSIKDTTMPWLANLQRFGKPVVLVVNKPLPIIVPEGMKTVVCTYSLLRTSFEVLSRFLYNAKD